MGATSAARHRGRTIAVVAAVVALLAVVGLVAFTVLVPQWGGNVPSGVACRDLPALSTVEEALDAKAGLVQRIQGVGPMVDVMATAPCQGRYGDRGEIYISFATFDERDRVLAILEREPFGVPVSLFNV